MKIQRVVARIKATAGNFPFKNYRTKEHKAHLDKVVKEMEAKYPQVKITVEAKDLSPKDFPGRRPPVTWSGPGFILFCDQPSDMPDNKWTKFYREFTGMLRKGSGGFSSLGDQNNPGRDGFVQFKTMTNPIEED